MVHDLNRQWNEQLSESEVQRHTNIADAAMRAEQHYQSPTKPPSQVWHRLFSIARYVIAAIAIVGLLFMVVGLLIFVVSVVAAVWGTVSPG